MKTTRSKLLKFILETSKEKANLEFITDKLIESGFVEIEEGLKEFWVFEDSEGDMYISLSEDLIKYNPNKTPKTPMVKKGKFHSVDQCRKYEKMWNKLKERILEMKKYRHEEMEAYIKIPSYESYKEIKEAIKAIETIERIMSELEKGK